MAPPPRSLAQCVVGGKVNVVRFLQHRAKMEEKRFREIFVVEIFIIQQSTTELTAEFSPLRFETSRFSGRFVIYQSTYHPNLEA
jgi:hypothetical protein